MKCVVYHPQMQMYADSSKHIVEWSLTLLKEFQLYMHRNKLLG